MALNHIRDILKKGFEDNPQNKLFGKISSAIYNAGKIPEVYELWAMLPNDDISDMGKQNGADNPIQSESIRDFRVQLATFSNFRRFPTFGENGICFGIPFFKLNKKHFNFFRKDNLKNQEPLSAVILGANGVGKTSIYSAMEVAAYGYSYIAAAHGYKTTENQDKYFCHGSGDNEPQVNVFTPNYNLKYPGSREVLIPPTFFCSEYDIFAIQQNKITSRYLFNQLGKGDLIELHTRLNKILPLFSIISDITILKNAMEDPNLSGEKKISLDKQLKEKKADGRRFLEVDRWLSNYESSVAKERQIELKAVIDYLQYEIDEILDTLQPIAEKFLSVLLNPFIKDDGGRILVKKENNTLTINIAFSKDDGTIYSLEPRQYFNTFRVKVFAVSLKIALSCCIKTQNRINSPIVLDDTFDASDFNTKHKIREFISILVTEYNSVKELKQYPLQLIFFTQDDIIAESAYLGFKDSELDIIYSRIFDYNQCNKTDVIKIKVDNANLEFTCISDNIE